MNYWVVSPNARNNGKANDYLKLIKATKRVLMGWGDTDKLGKVFKNDVAIDDVVLIAQGSNKNKKLFYCALIASKSDYVNLKVDNIEFDGQSRKLKYFTDISSALVNFNFEECAYGGSSQIPAIYRLKPNENNCDKNLANFLKKEINITKEEKIMEERINLLTSRHQIILQGPPGTGKTRLAKQMAIKMIDNLLPIETNDDIKDSLTKIDSSQVKLIQFHPSYSYEDFVRGISAKTIETKNDKGEIIGSTIKYVVENKILAEMAKKAEDDKDKKPYILIIDEINRANLSSVLGELIYALEYRDEAVDSMYELDDSRKIVLPSNLYIIGTMNTADRSIGHIDYAIRRRFAFENVLPSIDVDNVDKVKFQEVEDIFKHISPEFEKDRVMLGHSYFLGNTNESKEKLKYQVVPLLEEYISDGILIDSKELREKIKKFNESNS